MSLDYNRYKNLLSFILSERLLTITVLGSIFTFQFISSFKFCLVDPLLDFVIPPESFGFLNIVIREGVPMYSEPKQISLDFGNFFKSLITYIFLISVLFMLAKFTRWQDEPRGNPGSAIM